MNVSKPLALQPSEAAFQIGDLAVDYVRSEIPIRSEAVAFPADFFRSVHHDGDRKAVILAGVLDQALPVFRTNIRSIYNGQFSAREPFVQHVVQRVEGILRAGLIVLIVAD